MELNRKEARTLVYEMLFEADFRSDDSPEAIFDTARSVRDIPSDDYIDAVFYGVTEHKAELDARIEGCSNGWKASRISRPAITAMRIAVFEMLYSRDIPYSVSINEAVELVKKYDDDKARAFVNGVLNKVKDNIAAEASPEVLAVKGKTFKKKSSPTQRKEND